MRNELLVPPKGNTDVWAEPEIDLDPGYYERSIAARRRGHESLDDLTDLFDDIEARAEALLEDLMGVLEKG